MKQFKNIKDNDINVGGKTIRPEEEFEDDEKRQEIKNLKKQGYIAEIK